MGRGTDHSRQPAVIPLTARRAGRHPDAVTRLGNGAAALIDGSALGRRADGTWYEHSYVLVPLPDSDDVLAVDAEPALAGVTRVVVTPCAVLSPENDTCAVCRTPGCVHRDLARDLFGTRGAAADWLSEAWAAARIVTGRSVRVLRGPDPGRAAAVIGWVGGVTRMCIPLIEHHTEQTLVLAQADSVSRCVHCLSRCDLPGWLRQEAALLNAPFFAGLAAPHLIDRAARTATHRLSSDLLAASHWSVRNENVLDVRTYVEGVFFTEHSMARTGGEYECDACPRTQSFCPHLDILHAAFG